MYVDIVKHITRFTTKGIGDILSSWRLLRRYLHVEICDYQTSAMWMKTANNRTVKRV